MTAALAQPGLKLSQMASVRNGEIPVILVYVRDQVPQNYKLVAPEEAAELLAVVEFMRDQIWSAVNQVSGAEGQEKNGVPDEQK